MEGLCMTQVIDYTRQIVEGLKFLHSRYVAHMDIKPENVLLTNLHEMGLYQTAKLADVDNPTILKGSQTTPDDTFKPGTRRYFSPEMHMKLTVDPNVKVGRKTDIWSLGYLVHDLLYRETQCSLRRSSDSKTFEEPIRCFEKNGNEVCHRYMCQRLKRFLELCLHENHELRSSAQDLAVKSDFLTGGPRLSQLLDPGHSLWSCLDCVSDLVQSNQTYGESLRRWVKETNVIRCPFSSLLDSPDDHAPFLDSCSPSFNSRILADHTFAISHRYLFPSRNDRFVVGQLCGDTPFFGLVKLDLRGASGSAGNVAIRNYPRIKHLTLHEDQTAPMCLSTLKSISLDHLNIKILRRDELAELFLVALPNLTSLCITIDIITDLGMHDLLEMPKLKRLSLLLPATKLALALRSDSIIRFDLVFSPCAGPMGCWQSAFTPAAWETGQFLFPNLEEIQLINCPNQVLSSSFAMEFPKLRTFSAVTCSNLRVQNNALKLWPQLRHFTVLPALPVECCSSSLEFDPTSNYAWIERYLFVTDTGTDEALLEIFAKKLGEQDCPSFNCLRKKYVNALCHTLLCSSCQKLDAVLETQCLDVMFKESPWFLDQTRKSLHWRYSDCDQTESGTGKPVTPTSSGNIITILVLGETGVGKSTFVNAFANFLAHKTMSEAKKNLIRLIPSYFRLYTPNNFQPRQAPTSGNESGTLHPRCYRFRVGDTDVQLIDTPGIEDTKGGQTDGTRMQNLLNFLADYKEINAICILLRPNNSRVGVVFRCCVLELLSALNKSASRNVLFLFTDSRGTFYPPGDTAPSLLKVLKEAKNRPPHAEIAFGKNNVYCFDNGAFRFLVAKSRRNSTTFPLRTELEHAESWEQNSALFRKMMEFILTLPPHETDRGSAYEARMSVQALIQPLARISHCITENVRACNKQRQFIEEFQGTIASLQKQLYTPAIDIIPQPLENPKTVCGDARCCETVVINGKTKTHYKVVCHDSCYLPTNDGNIIGNIGLLDCQSFNKYERIGSQRLPLSEAGLHPDQFEVLLHQDRCTWIQMYERIQSETCYKCGHSYTTHLHVYTDTKMKDVPRLDEVSFQKIIKALQARKAREKQVRILESTVEEWRQESEEINRCLSVFACFMSTQALTPYNDAYEGLLNYLIRTDKASAEVETSESARELESLLTNYRLQKKTFQAAFSRGDVEADISARAVKDAINSLCRLPKCGSKIRDYLLYLFKQAAPYAWPEEKASTSRAHGWKCGFKLGVGLLDE